MPQKSPPSARRRVTRTGHRRNAPGRWARLRRNWLGPALVAPSFIGVGIFVYGFIAFTVFISTTERWNPFNHDTTVRDGVLGNYSDLFATPRFQADLRNTVVFTLLFLFVSVAVGMALALLVHHVVVGRAFFRSVFLFPYALSFIVTGVVWRWIFTPQTGVNLLLRATGVSSAYQSLTGKPLQPDWITDPDVVGQLNGVMEALIPGGTYLHAKMGIPLALIPVVIAAAWQLGGFAMAMYLAGLAAIPDEVREAAMMDGAGPLQTYRKVILPMLRPVTVTTVVILGHVSLKIFDLVYAMAGSGVGFSTDVPGIFVYEQMFRALRYNLGGAASIVMLLLVCAVVVPYLARTYTREDH
ncbi:carbohydrate ABC transporter permease [Streptomyces sp. SLBN-118]|uniref:carbohydrate ABC transporter permease n=1 Tax=Streptomyces sp. SLBN-118 TaxID=2768454 RepID=UPI001153E6FB|nr:sugar ABC transporter permease [Streptomyces sp. SLBN-118]